MKLSIDDIISITKNFFNDNKIILIIMLAIIILSTLLVNIKGKNKKREITYDRKQNDPLLSQTENNEEIQTIAYKLLSELKLAMMDLDIDKIKDITTNNIYDLYKRQIETLKTKKLKNKVQNIKYVKSYITNTTNNSQITNLRLIIECFDYIIDSNNNVVKGKYNRKMLQTYEIEILKSNTTYLIQKLELLYESEI